MSEQERGPCDAVLVGRSSPAWNAGAHRCGRRAAQPHINALGCETHAASCLLCTSNGTDPVAAAVMYGCCCCVRWAAIAAHVGKVRVTVCILLHSKPLGIYTMYIPSRVPAGHVLVQGKHEFLESERHLGRVLCWSSVHLMDSTIMHSDGPWSQGHGIIASPDLSGGLLQAPCWCEAGVQARQEDVVQQPPRRPCWAAVPFLRRSGSQRATPQLASEDGLEQAVSAR